MEELQKNLPNKEEAMFNFSTVYSQPIMEDYLKSGRYNTIKVGILFFVLAAFMIGFGIEYASFLIYMGIFMVFLVALIVWAGVYNERNVRKNYSTILETRFEYFVYDESLYVESVGPNAASTIVLEVRDILDFNETDLIIFARFKNNQVYIFDKEELRQIEKYDMLKRIFLNNSKSYRGVRINHKKDYVNYEYHSKSERKTKKGKSESQVELLVTLLFAVSFLSFILDMFLLEDNTNWLIFALTTFVHMTSLLYLIVLKQKYKRVRYHGIYIVLVSMFIAVSFFAFGVSLYY